MREGSGRARLRRLDKRMLGYKGPAQPSPTLGDALNAGYVYLEVHCHGCETNQTVALSIIRRPKATSIHELERRMCSKQCSKLAGGRSSVPAPPVIGNPFATVARLTSGSQ
jgi:hypothetical protein